MHVPPRESPVVRNPLRPPIFAAIDICRLSARRMLPCMFEDRNVRRPDEQRIRLFPGQHPFADLRMMPHPEQKLEPARDPERFSGRMGVNWSLGESNPHARGPPILSRVCLPVPASDQASQIPCIGCPGNHFHATPRWLGRFCASRLGNPIKILYIQHFLSHTRSFQPPPVSTIPACGREGADNRGPDFAGRACAAGKVCAAGGGSAQGVRGRRPPVRVFAPLTAPPP